MPWKHTLEEYYFNAVPMPFLTKRVSDTLKARGISPGNTLLANSSCRDELNKPHADDLSQVWGANFNLCGLGGIPSAGLTGFRAYNSHVPDNGNMLIFFGPHIGINVEGDMGVIRREGMREFTPTCGALSALLDKLRTNRQYEAPEDELDTEQAALEHALLADAKKALNSATPLKDLTEAAYRMIEARIRMLIEKADVKHQIVLLGGITINLPLDLPDFFALRTSEILHYEREIGRVEPWNPLKE